MSTCWSREISCSLGTNGPRSPSLSNPGSPKAASYGKQGQGSTAHRRILDLSLPVCADPSFSTS